MSCGDRGWVGRREVLITMKASMGDEGEGC